MTDQPLDPTTVDTPDMPPITDPVPDTPDTPPTADPAPDVPDTPAPPVDTQPSVDPTPAPDDTQPAPDPTPVPDTPPDAPPDDLPLPVDNSITSDEILLFIVALPAAEAVRHTDTSRRIALQHANNALAAGYSRAESIGRGVAAAAEWLHRGGAPADYHSPPPLERG